MTLSTLATLFRAMQLVAHAAHNLVKGPTFFSDHEYLGELYPAYEEAYDSLIERSIGLKMPINIQQITTEACRIFGQSKITGDAKADLTIIDRLEVMTRKEIAVQMKANPSDGVQNLLQGLADDSEARSYKIGQRVG